MINKSKVSKAKINKSMFKSYVYTKTSGNAGGAVAGTERIVLTLASLREACQPRRLPQSVHLVPPSRQDLVRICLEQQENVETIISLIFTTTRTT